MSRRYTRTSAAEHDIVQIATWLAQRDSRLAVRFLDALEATCEFLTRSPDVGSIYTAGDELLEGMRVWRVDGFRNHLIYYRMSGDAVQIVRVLHAARDIASILGGPQQ